MYLDSLSLCVDAGKCTACGACVMECVNHVLKQNSETGRPQVANGGEARCIHCAHCMMACPAGALSIDNLKQEAFSADVPPANYKSVLELVKRRRSVRHYLQKNVERAVLDELLTDMRYTPTGVNFGKLHFTVIDDIEVMNKFRYDFYSAFRKRTAGGSILLTEALAWSEAFFEHDDDPVFRTAPHLIVASHANGAFCGHDDCVIALSYFELLANAHGLGTVWFGRLMTIFARFMPELVEALKIPDGYKPGYAMLFGYPDTNFHSCVERAIPEVDRPKEIIVPE